MNMSTVSPSASNIKPEGSGGTELAAYGNKLHRPHAQMLADSAIAPEVARERGYYTETDKEHLRKLDPLVTTPTSSRA